MADGPAAAVERVQTPNNFTTNRDVALRLERALATLTKDEQRVIRQLMTADLNGEEKASLLRVTDSPGFKSANIETTAAILRFMARQRAADLGNGTQISWVLREPAFAQLSSTDQRRVIGLIADNPKEMLLPEHLGKLLARTLPDGTPAILSKDLEGRKTLLDRLVEISAMKVHTDIATAAVKPRPITAGSVLTAVVRECAAPTREVDQGGRGACAAAVIQDQLCRFEPAEFARLTLGLFSNKQVRMAGGGNLKVLDDSIVPAGSPGTGDPDLRSHPERIFQSALLDYSSTKFRYSYLSDQKGIPVDASPLTRVAAALMGTKGDTLGFRSGGMTDGEMTRALHGVFGKPYEAVTGKPADIHAALKGARGTRLVAMKWGDGYHALCYCGTHDGWVYLKDPNGGGRPEDGKGPEREATGAHGANIRMSVKEFEANLDSGFVVQKRAAVLQLPPAAMQVAPPVVQAGAAVLDVAKKANDALPQPKEVIEKIAETNRRVEQLVLPAAQAAVALPGAAFNAGLRWIRGN